MICTCGREAHPLYGSKCEECWVESSHQPSGVLHYGQHDHHPDYKYRAAYQQLMRDVDSIAFSVERGGIYGN